MSSSTSPTTATNNPARRRGKKKSSETTTTAPPSQEQLKAKTDEKLSQALRTVTINKQKAHVLHQQWRSYLLKISYMMVLLSIHQTKGALSEWNNIMAWRCEIVNAILSILTVFFLRDINRRESSSDMMNGDYWYMGMSGTVLLAISVYFQTQSIDGVGVVGDDNKKRTEFPSGVIYFLMVTMACAFMNHGMAGVDENITIVRELKSKMDETRRAASDMQQRLKDVEKKKKKEKEGGGK